MSYKYGFERLNVWQDTRVLVKDIYKLTAEFPSSEKFGLINQMRRCAISISSNIAEGSGRKTAKDQAHFYSIAYSSCLELVSQLILSSDLEFMEAQTLAELRERIEYISNRIYALRNKQKR